MTGRFPIKIWGFEMVAFPINLADGALSGSYPQFVLFAHPLLQVSSHLIAGFFPSPALYNPSSASFLNS